jgi:hypothetical protein
MTAIKYRAKDTILTFSRFYSYDENKIRAKIPEYQVILSHIQT